MILSVITPFRLLRPPDIALMARAEKRSAPHFLQ
jgi:hypothetical protein